ncbi:undecaprenyl-diphosphate phosphatase [Arcobacter sp. FWKO B]|uniref:undecaprenyl-diphosphate phosphatase n=1 Tax=Arcobacter sp. FWKO B TaxID=2593672 RepID=UPI0018A5E7B9|nr:undecaprenyl-diphosphate phosphatase [Arcobacter sp. FWKO B]QOG12660.1 undecaprenyl-diphosphate phosphatase [Arcobacter sp. FWKO B]
MSIFEAIILGIIEGFTEFLPISSTGHMIIAADMMGIDENNMTSAFMIIIQFAAIWAVIFNYKDKFTPKKINLWMKIVLAFIPIGLVGFLFASTIKELFDSTVVAYAFIIGGVIFLIVEKYYKKEEHLISDVEKVSYKQALYIGLAQVLALIPGASRAGASIIGAMLVGLNRKASAEFSFLLALPVMCATTGYDLVKHYDEFIGANLIVLAVGFVTSFIIAYITMKLFIEFLSRFTFVAFGIYRIIIGLLLLAFFV